MTKIDYLIQENAKLKDAIKKALKELDEAPNIEEVIRARLPLMLVDDDKDYE